jgi:hypothetical protein
MRWQAGMQCDHHDWNVPQFPYMDLDELSDIKTSVLEIIEMSPDVLPSHFTVALLNNKEISFQEMAKLSRTVSPFAQWFHTLFKLTTKEMKHFVLYCQELKLCILQCYYRMTNLETMHNQERLCHMTLKYTSSCEAPALEQWYKICP